MRRKSGNQSRTVSVKPLRIYTWALTGGVGFFRQRKTFYSQLRQQAAVGSFKLEKNFLKRTHAQICILKPSQSHFDYCTKGILLEYINQTTREA